MLIYCSHCFGNKEANKKLVEEKIIELQVEDLDNVYVSPIHALGHLYDKIPYEQGIELCLDILTSCDALYVLSKEISKGVQKEIELAEILGMPIYYLDK